MSTDGAVAASRGQRTALTSEAANRHAMRVRAEVDAIAIGVGTVLVDDPLLTARGAYRELPLTRVVWDRRLRTPPGARLLSTRDAGPVIIMTTPTAAARPEIRMPLEERGAEILETDGSLRSGLEALGSRGISSVLLEGGAALHEAAWMERVVDLVRLYVTPHVLGPGGVAFLNGRTFSTLDLVDRRIEPVGPDVLMEGYVHRTR
jgi:diaminohydroxyphosphoribosylaminopyrimidine deaminase/5-amino-6-(5-phosphoribosylamino)uracil reductase